MVNKCCLCLIVAIAIAVALGAFGTVMYFQLFDGRTEKLKYQVIFLWLNQFNLNNNDTVLQYDLTIRATIENPNRESSYIMKRTEMVAFPAFDQTYLSPNFSLSPNLMVFHKEVQTFFPRFKGQRPVELGADELNKFKHSRLFDFVFRIYVDDCYTKIGARIVHYKQIVTCYLNDVYMQMVDSEIPQAYFTDCEVDKTRIS